MAILSDVVRAEIWAQLMRDMSDVREPIPVKKTVLRTVLNAADQWAQDNAASYRAAINAAGGTTLTNAQAARMLAAVVQKRWTVGA